MGRWPGFEQEVLGASEIKSVLFMVSDSWPVFVSRSDSAVRAAHGGGCSRWRGVVGAMLD